MLEVIHVGGMKTVKTQAATNHVYLVDVSGSMHSSLPSMRQHLKNIVTMITQPEDTFTIIYFSGRGQCGVVCEGVPVNDIGSVTSVQQAIDRWLRPIGLTGFAEPIQLAMDTVKNLPNDKFNNFVMLSDGYDNQSNRNQVVENAAKLPQFFNSTSFIEYGWYCDRELLAKMAEVSGGFHLFAEGYEDYERTFDETITSAIRVPRVEVKMNKRAKHAVYVHNDRIAILDVNDNNTVSVPEDVEKVFSIVPKDVLQKQLSEDHLYLIMYYAVKMSNSKLVWRCLEALGDVALIDLFTNAFTRQELTTFTETVEQCVLSPSLRYATGKDMEYIPDENATTVLDVLGTLDRGENVKVVLDSPHFRYSRTTRATKTEQELPRFIEKPGSLSDVTGLVYNSTRPNVSIQTLVKGSVELPENDFDMKYVPSKRYKNYTVIRDGILNVKRLHVVIGISTLTDLMSLETVDRKFVEIIEQDPGTDENSVVIYLERLPVINRKMSEPVDLDAFVTTVRLLKAVQGEVKGLKSQLSEKDSKSEGMAELYGTEAAKWLSSIGVRDYGFSPKVVTQEPTDSYLATEVEIKAKGLNSLPSANAAVKKVNEGKKMTVGEYLVYQGIVEAEEVRTEEQLKDLIKVGVDTSRTLNFHLSQMIYSMIIGKTWFDGVEEDVVTSELNYNGYQVPLTVELVRKEMKI